MRVHIYCGRHKRGARSTSRMWSRLDKLLYTDNKIVSYCEGSSGRELMSESFCGVLTPKTSAYHTAQVLL